MFKFGQHGNASGSLIYPSDVAYSPDGERLAVADRFNHRIQVFDADTGAFVFKFGQHGNADGSLSWPVSVDYSPLP